VLINWLESGQPGKESIMADREKIKILFEKLNLKEQFSAISAQASRAFGERIGKEEGRVLDSEMIELHKKIHTYVFGRMIDYTMDVFERHFTDEELNKFIDFYLSPAYQKMLELVPTLVPSMIDFLSEVAEEVDREIMEPFFQDKARTRFAAETTNGDRK